MLRVKIPLGLVELPRPLVVREGLLHCVTLQRRPSTPSTLNLGSMTTPSLTARYQLAPQARGIFGESGATCVREEYPGAGARLSCSL